ncbi:hypothetical protein D3C75_743760 [compost metagenome]
MAQAGKPGKYLDSPIAESVAVQMLERFLPQSGEVGDVQLFLLGQQLGGLKGLNLVRQLFEHIALQAAQQKGPDPSGNGLPGQIVEGFFAREQSGEYDAVYGPKILQRIFHRCPGQGEAVARLQGFYRLRGLGGMVLDHLRFVQNESMEGTLDVQLHIPAQQRVGGNKDITACCIPHSLAPRGQVPIGDSRLDLRSEALQLILPVVEQGGRRNNERRHSSLTDILQLREQESDALQRFAQPHIICQDASEAVMCECLHPLEAILLVIPQHRGECLRHWKVQILRTMHIGQQPAEGTANADRIGSPFPGVCVHVQSPD